MMAQLDRPQIRWRPLVVADWREAFAVCRSRGEPIVVRDADGVARRLHLDGSATEVLDIVADVQIGSDNDA